MRRVTVPDREGYSFDDATHVLRVFHEHSRNISIHGDGGNAPAKYLTFDRPHRPAQSALDFEYPSGLIDWGKDVWMIHAPEGKFGTFNLSLKDRKQATAGFSFSTSAVFVGIDAYNGGARAATIQIRSPQQREQSYTLQPGQLLRIRTGWRDPSSAIELHFENGEGLLFDNLAYVE